MESSRIFVKGLPPNITEADFRKHFASGGHITDIKLIPQRRIGYVGYKSPQEASKAIKYFNRTFIRMSKIFVELARPVADPLLPKPRNKFREDESNKAAPPPVVTPSASNEPAESSPKKRKREELDESDPKLQEYLGVMQPTKSSRLELQDSFEEPPKKIQSLNPEEDASDDEYQAFPKRDSNQNQQPQAKKPIARDPPAGTESHPILPKDPLKERQNETPMELDSQEVTDAAADPAPLATSATDDDWLRSRTNRLLDLVGDDDEIPVPTIPQRHETAEDDEHEHPKPNPQVAEQEDDEVMGEASPKPADGAKDDSLETLRRTKRLFIRNLPYNATEDDLRQHFAEYGDLEEAHLPTGTANNANNANKGFAFVLFAESEAAVKAFQEADGTPFQGRLLHILPASAKRDHNLDDYALSKLPLKQQNLIRKRAQAATSKFNWNSLYMSTDAVNSSVADRLGVSKSDLLDPTNSDAAVKQAIIETSTIQDTKAYFAAHGVDLNAFKVQARGDDIILVKNFPYGTTAEELRTLFEEHGQVLRVLMPPTGTIAIVHFAQPTQGKTAFGKLAYRRFKNSVLYLEKGPKNLLVGVATQPTAETAPSEAVGVQKLSVSELLDRGNDPEQAETSTLFVRNLNFATNTAQLAEAFNLEGFRSARVKTKPDPQKPGQTLSMGFGFVEFTSKAAAEAAQKVMDGHTLQGHQLVVRASHRGQDAAEERRKEDMAKKRAGQKTKVVIKNLPFQASKKDLRSLCAAYGQVRMVRIPKKLSNQSKGFGFVDFVSPRDAENAINALQHTHLLGRRLVLDFAEAEAVDAEEEIAKMQKKVGRQVDRVALQQLTGGGRKKVNLGNENEEE